MLTAKRWKRIYLLLLCLLTGGITQGADTDDVKKNDVFAPFVSRLKTKENDYNITLTWLDSDDVEGDNLIYRYTEPISEKNINKASLLARITPGVELYYDYPPDTQNYFYAVLIEASESKKRYDLFIPFRNITSLGISIRSAGALEEVAARISGIKIASSIKGIYVTFNTNRANRTLTMYRSNNPIENTTDLENTISWPLVQGTTSYLDLPPAGLDYYYAVLDSELARQDKANLLKGENATRYPAKIPFFSSGFKAYETRTLRPDPLPLLTLQKDLETGQQLDKSNFNLPQEKKLKPATEKIVARLITSLAKANEDVLTYTLLAIEKTESKTEDDKALKSIVQECLVPGLQTKAIKQLRSFINENERSGATINRAHFYLGQAYYFDRQYQNALLEMVIAQDEYYVETTPWIIKCFSNLEES